jgi:hypothetical protein
MNIYFNDNGEAVSLSSLLRDIKSSFKDKGFKMTFTEFATQYNKDPDKLLKDIEKMYGVKDEIREKWQQIKSGTSLSGYGGGKLPANLDFEKKEEKILGMHKSTFTYVAVAFGVLAVVGGVATFMYLKNKAVDN